MKNTVLILLIILTAISCKTQNIIPLEDVYAYKKSPDGIPEYVTHVKDLNNRLDQFVGTWKGSYNGKNYEFKFEKRIDFGNNSIKWDKLIGRLKVKDVQNNVIYNSMDKSDDNTMLSGYDIQNNVYVMDLIVNTYCNDMGDLFIELKKNNPNQMIINFERETDIFDPNKCPNYSTYTTLVPKNEIILTKQ